MLLCAFVCYATQFYLLLPPGLAFTSTLCRTDGKSVSVVEDLGGFQAVDTAAHELGHR